jgi:hypothetical protein
MPLPFKVGRAQTFGAFQLDRELLNLVKENKGVKIVGLYVEGNLYKGALLAREAIRPEQLPSRKALPPRIILDLPTTGHISIRDSRPLRIFVRGFDARQPLEIELDGSPIDAKQYTQTVDNEGTVTIEIHVPFAIGPHKVLVRQRIGERIIQDVSSFHVTPSDEGNQR